MNRKQIRISLTEQLERIFKSSKVKHRWKVVNKKYEEGELRIKNMYSVYLFMKGKSYKADMILYRRDRIHLTDDLFVNFLLRRFKDVYKDKTPINYSCKLKKKGN